MKHISDILEEKEQDDALTKQMKKKLWQMICNNVTLLRTSVSWLILLALLIPISRATFCRTRMRPSCSLYRKLWNWKKWHHGHLKNYLPSLLLKSKETALPQPQSLLLLQRRKTNLCLTCSNIFYVSASHILWYWPTGMVENSCSRVTSPWQ